MTPFKVSLCSLVHLLVEKPDYYPKEVRKIVIEYVLDQLQSKKVSDQESDMIEKSLAQLKSDLKARVIDHFQKDTQSNSMFNQSEVQKMQS